MHHGSLGKACCWPIDRVGPPPLPLPPHSVSDNIHINTPSWLRENTEILHPRLRLSASSAVVGLARIRRDQGMSVKIKHLYTRMSIRGFGSLQSQRQRGWNDSTHWRTRRGLPRRGRLIGKLIIDSGGLISNSIISLLCQMAI